MSRVTQQADLGTSPSAPPPRRVDRRRAQRGRVGATAPEPLAERAYRVIKAQIVTFEMQPGSVVIAHRLADELGMSVTPVHDALKRLCAEGLAQVIPRTGYSITPVTLADVQEIFALRLSLEPLAVELAMRRLSERDLAGFREEVYRPSPPHSGRSLSRWERLFLMGEVHDHFHLAIARLSGNRRLVRMIRELLDQGRRLTLSYASGDPPVAPPDAPPGPLGAHRDIAEALLARDHSGAVAAMADHIRAEHRNIVEYLTSVTAPP